MIKLFHSGIDVAKPNAFGDSRGVQFTGGISDSWKTTIRYVKPSNQPRNRHLAYSHNQPVSWEIPISDTSSREHLFSAFFMRLSHHNYSFRSCLGALPVLNPIPAKNSPNMLICLGLTKLIIQGVVVGIRLLRKFAFIALKPDSSIGRALRHAAYAYYFADDSS